jgi:hypothetical protein
VQSTLIVNPKPSPLKRRPETVVNIPTKPFFFITQNKVLKPSIHKTALFVTDCCIKRGGGVREEPKKKLFSFLYINVITQSNPSTYIFIFKLSRKMASVKVRKE